VGDYVSTSDIQARLPGVTFTEETKPSTTSIGTWITMAEGMLTAALKASGTTTPITDVSGIQIAKALVSDYVEGRVRIALDSSSSDDANGIGPQMVKDFRDLIEQIANGTGAAIWGAMMSGGSPSAKVAIRGHVINNPDGETIADGDFDPEFTRSEVW